MSRRPSASFSRAMAGVGAVLDRLPDAEPVGVSWRRLGELFSRSPLRFRIRLESEAHEWADSVLVVEVVLAERPTPEQMKRLARLWPEIHGSPHVELIVSYANENEDTVPIFDYDQVAIRYALAAPPA